MIINVMALAESFGYESGFEVVDKAVGKMFDPKDSLAPNELLLGRGGGGATSSHMPFRTRVSNLA